MAASLNRRRRWRVKLYNPLAFRRLGRVGQGANLYTDAFTMQEAEGATMGRAFTRALQVGGEDFLAQVDNTASPYDFCGAALHAFNMARAAMVERSEPTYRVAVTVRWFTVEIERVR